MKQIQLKINRENLSDNESEILAFDINEWAYINCLENIKTNKTPNIKVNWDNIENIVESSFDIILANINLYVLKTDIPTYTQKLKSHGLHLISGFYCSDIPAIAKVCDENKLLLISCKEKNHWVCMKFKKK